MLIIIIVIIIYGIFIFIFNLSYLGVLRDGNPLQDYKFLNKGWIKSIFFQSLQDCHSLTA